MQDILVLQNKLIDKILWLRRRVFVRAIQRTLLSLFPFALLGSIAKVISISILSNSGFINNIFSISTWFPKYRMLRILFNCFSSLTVGILALLAAYFCARNTAILYKKNEQSAGITGLITFLIVCTNTANSNSNNNLGLLSVNAKMLGVNSLLLGLFVGYIVGQIYRYFSNVTIVGGRTHAQDILEKSFNSLLAILVSLIFGIMINGIIAIIVEYGAYDAFENYITKMSLNHSNISITIIGTMITTLLAWMGFSGPYQYRSFADDNISIENLNYALKHHSVWGVPHPFSEFSLYHSFGAFGGVGSILALIVAILIVSKAGNYRRVGTSGLLPTLFNSGTSVMLGLPVLFNPLYLIPFFITPLLNMLIATLAMITHLMPPVVYPVPLGTPGPLVAFIGTGGNFAALFVGILVFFLDILIYIPFVKLNEQIWLRLQVIYLKEDE